MDNYNLTLSVFIFFSTLYISIQIQKINIKNTIKSIFLSLFVSTMIYFAIKFINSIPYSSAIKHSFLILNIYLIYLTFKFSLLKNEELFIKTFYGYKIVPDIEINKIYMSFIGLSFYLYGILYFDNINIFSFILFLLIPLTLLLGTINQIIITLIVIITIQLNFYLIFTTIISLVLIKLFNLFLVFLNEKYFEKVSYYQILKIEYNFLFDSTYEFISKFKTINSDFYILYFYDEKEDITYSVGLDIKEKVKNIAAINKLNFFLLYPLSKNKINVSFDNIKFYYNHGETYNKTINSNQIDVLTESANLEDIIRQKIKLKEILNY